MRHVFHNGQGSLLLRNRNLNDLYAAVIARLNKAEDIAYSRHYVLQLHIQHMCDTLESFFDDMRCLTHSDITETKCIDIGIEECFCKSLKNRPLICLHCRNIYK